MCGIAGFFHFDAERRADAGTVKKMTDSIAHRGPDGEGFYVKQNVALGHRRLSIIDITTGQQPMFSEDGELVLVFNGEIYNYLELKEELTKLGYRFTTTSDTEVIINAYRAWGVDCQNHFNGMWAFALWDRKEQRLFLSRDRIGEKPLYFAQRDHSFVFGSEIKAILAYGFPAEPRMEMTELYLTLGYMPAPYTFYKNIHQLQPGHCLLVSANGVKEETYWRLPDLTEKDMIRDQAAVEKSFATLFDDSVRIRMRSDVSFGAFLSGGLDSSCVVGTMSHHTALPVQTFTMGFENKQFDERHLAKLVADKFHTDHHVGVVSSEHFEDALQKVLASYDEPFGDPSAIPTGHISKYATKYVKMVLTGDGGDEVLSGYNIYKGEKLARQYQALPLPLRKFIPWATKKIAVPFKGNLRYSLNRVAKVLDSCNQSFEQRLVVKLLQTSPGDLATILLPKQDCIRFTDFYKEAMKDCRFTDSFYQLMYFQHKVSLPGDMLTKVDRMSMAYSLETRVPFLDHRIIELLFGVHKDLKMNGYLNKVILRNTVAREVLPKELLGAPKKGFSVPLRDWFKEENLNNHIRSLLLDKSNNQVYQVKGLERLIDQNREGQSDVGNFIWMMVVLKKWMNSMAQVETEQPVGVLE